jgi:phosphatidylinositol glycan class W
MFILGYLAIHLLGLATGTVILPPSPSDFRRQQNMFKNRHIRNDADSKNVFKYAERQDGKTAIELFSYALLWWLAFGLCWLVGLGGGVSRRLVIH